MKVKFFSTVLVLFSAIVNAQILYDYPAGQDFYEGGKIGFLREMIDVIHKNKSKPCDKTEALLMRFVVYPDKSVRYVTDEDKNAVENNKCLKDKVLENLKTLKKFKPAEVNKVKVAAMFFATFTDDMFTNSFSSKEDFTMPVYMHKGKEEGIEKFRENFANCFDTRGFRTVGNDYSFKLNFDVSTDGEVGFFYIDNMSNLADFNTMVVKCASNTKKSYWKAGTYKGVPVKQIFKIPIKFLAN
ncbi:hypothetical protein ASG21_13275 [Chryseobacterium sp. Leaf394]|nr:hypothetical protein ASG21_13275 [Chryseobacterium sp. Leaf394]